MPKKDTETSAKDNITPKKTVVKKSTRKAAMSNTSPSDDSSKSVEIKVNKLTEKDIEGVFDKIIERNTKDKPPVKVKYRPPKKVKQEVVNISTPTAADKREAIRKNKADEKASRLKREANQRVAELTLEADRMAAELRVRAEEKAAEIRMEANAKVARINGKANKKAVKRELKETIKRAKQETAEKLGKTVKSKPVKKVVARSDRSEPVRKKPSLPRKLAKLSIGIFVVMLLCVGVGIAYTWYMGQNDVSAVSDVAPVAAASTSPIIKPQKTAVDAKVGVSIQYFSTPLTPGSAASMQIKTNPEARCTITAVYNDVTSKDSGLVTKTADEYGVVGWDWTVDSWAPLGKWPITVTCSNAKNSGMSRGDLVLVSKLN